MKRVTIFILALLLILSFVGCSNPQQKAIEDAIQGLEETIGNLDLESNEMQKENGSFSDDTKDKDLFAEHFGGYPAAASILPEPWMAYPDSIVDIDWVERGLSETPAWTLVAPAGTSREDVVDYYILTAEQRDDFETVETYHGVAGVWAWKGVNITIEPDVHYDYSELVQISFWFQEDYRS